MPAGASQVEGGEQTQAKGTAYSCQAGTSAQWLPDLQIL